MSFLSPNHKWSITRAVGAVIALQSCCYVMAQGQLDTCGDLANAYGPYDYRTDRGEKLRLVESAHFSPIIEALIRGKIPGSQPGPEIDYVLRAYPNHHRALVATMRLGDRFKTPMPPGMRYSTECWLLRATRFRPDDTVSRTLLAKYLAGTKRVPEAVAQLKVAETHAGDNPFTHYNIGLLYVETGEFDRALVQAHKAMALGFPRTELKDQLIAARKWQEPAASPTPSEPVGASPAGASPPAEPASKP